MQSDIKSDEISKKLLYVVYIFNDYLDNININNHNKIIVKLYEIYIEKNEKNKNFDLRNFICDSIHTNIRFLLNAVYEFKDDIIKSNSTILYYLTYTIYKSTLILYTYQYYLEKIDKYLNDNVANSFSDFITYLLIDEDINENLDKELEEVLQEALKTVDESEYEERNYADMGLMDYCDTSKDLTIDNLTIIYTKIIKKFLKDEIHRDNKDETISIDTVNTLGISFIENIKDEKKYKNALKTIYKHKGIYWFLIIKNFLLFRKISVSNNYITIPQYKGICWYVSILTGMCYSDASRNLIMSKIPKLQIKLHEPSKIEESEKSFIETIFYIINNITSKQLTYDTNIENKCDIFKYLKNILPSFLDLKNEEIAKKIIENPSIFKTIFNINDIVGNDEYYFINIFKQKFRDTTYQLQAHQKITKQELNEIRASIKEDINTIDTIPNGYEGITMLGFCILNLLYKMLDINTLYFVETDTIIYKRIEIQAIIPDVIIIQKLSPGSNENYGKFFKKSTLFNIQHEDIFEKNKDIIKLNGNIYKLDYVLYANANINGTCNRITGCGHCISGIHYHGKKYYYDSGHAEKNINCGKDEDIIIPCTLTRQDWNIQNTEVPNFTINKCFYRQVDVSKNNIQIEKEFIDESQRTFDNDDVICVYIKVSEDEASRTGGGSKNNYKSTNKKVNIMNKNKNIIERTIYIDNNDNKNIKFNKKYEPLSNFKFNKKNKYYYM